MEFENITIDSKFLCVAPTDYAVVAKFSIIVNGESFEYTQSPHWLAQQYKKLKGKVWYSTTGHDWILNDVIRDKSCITKDQDEDKYSLKLANGKGYWVDIKDSRWLRFFADLSKLKLAMTDEENLFAFRCVLQDALMPLDYTEEEFVSDMGYEGDYKSVMRGIRVYNQCKDMFFKLKLGDSQIHKLLEQLSEQGIE
jgi:hypothetical protein